MCLYPDEDTQKVFLDLDTGLHTKNIFFLDRMDTKKNFWISLTCENENDCN